MSMSITKSVTLRQELNHQDTKPREAKWATAKFSGFVSLGPSGSILVARGILDCIQAPLTFFKLMERSAS